MLNDLLIDLFYFIYFLILQSALYLLQLTKKNVPGDFKLDINNPSNCTATEFLNIAKLFI